MRELAHKKAKEMGTLRHSITEGEGNIVGFLGEYAAWSIIGGKLPILTSTTYFFLTAEQLMLKVNALKLFRNLITNALFMLTTQIKNVIFIVLYG